MNKRNDRGPNHTFGASNGRPKDDRFPADEPVGDRNGFREQLYGYPEENLLQNPGPPLPVIGRGRGSLVYLVQERSSRPMAEVGAMERRSRGENGNDFFSSKPQQRFQDRPNDKPMSNQPYQQHPSRPCDDPSFFSETRGDDRGQPTGGSGDYRDREHLERRSQKEDPFVQRNQRRDHLSFPNSTKEQGSDFRRQGPRPLAEKSFLRSDASTIDQGSRTIHSATHKESKENSSRSKVKEVSDGRMSKGFARPCGEDGIRLGNVRSSTAYPASCQADSRGYGSLKGYTSTRNADFVGKGMKPSLFKEPTKNSVGSDGSLFSGSGPCKNSANSATISQDRPNSVASTTSTSTAASAKFCDNTTEINKQKYFRDPLNNYNRVNGEKASSLLAQQYPILNTIESGNRQAFCQTKALSSDEIPSAEKQADRLLDARAAEESSAHSLTDERLATNEETSRVQRHRCAFLESSSPSLEDRSSVDKKALLLENGNDPAVNDDAVFDNGLAAFSDDAQIDGVVGQANVLAFSESENKGRDKKDDGKPKVVLSAFDQSTSSTKPNDDDAVADSPRSKKRRSPESPILKTAGLESSIPESIPSSASPAPMNAQERYAMEVMPHQQMRQPYLHLSSDTDLDLQAKRFYHESIFFEGKLRPFSKELSNVGINRDLVINIHKRPNSAQLSPVHRYLWRAIIRGRDVVLVDKRPQSPEARFSFVVPLCEKLLSSRRIYDEIDKRMAKQKADKNSRPLRSNGPYILVLTPSWKSAEKIYKLFNFYMQHLRDPQRPKVILAYGGHVPSSSETDLLTELFNGCQVLITTPHKLETLLGTRPDADGLAEKAKTNLLRVYHLVFVEAERLVTRKFLPSVSRIFKKFTADLNLFDDARRKNLRNIIIVARSWTEELKHFAFHKTVQAVTIFSGRLEEAVIYGQVMQEALWVDAGGERRDDALLRILEATEARLLESSNGGKEGLEAAFKVVVCVSSQAELDHVTQLLKEGPGYEYFVGAVHEDYKMAEEVELLKKKWNTIPSDAQPHLRILVMMDDAIKNYCIADARVLVHYSVPSSPHRFKLRWGHLLHYFRCHVPGKSPKPLAESYLLLSDDERCKISANFIRQQILARSLGLDGRPIKRIPAELYRLAVINNESLAADRDKGLCRQLKAFGECENPIACEFRHHVVPAVDVLRGCAVPSDSNDRADTGLFVKSVEESEIVPPPLPTSGVVHLKILAIADATRLFARLSKHVDDDGRETYFFSEEADTSNEMQLYFQKNAEHLEEAELHALHPMTMLAYSQDGDEFERVVLEKVDVEWRSVRRKEAMKMNHFVHSDDEDDEDDPKQRFVRGLLLRFVDCGKAKEIDRPSARQLFRLPPFLRRRPFLAVEVFLVGIKPLDDDLEWTPQANSLVEAAIGQQLEGDVVFALGNTLWLNRLQKLETFSALGTGFGPGVVFDVATELLERSVAVENSPGLHLEKLANLCANSGLNTKANLPSDIYDSSGVESVDHDDDAGHIEVNDDDHKENLADNRADNHGDDFERLVSIESPLTTGETVFVSAVQSPLFFYVVKESSMILLASLSARIEEELAATSNENFQVAVGVDCVVRLCNPVNLSSCWLRANVESVVEATNDENSPGNKASTEIYLVDYGEVLDVPAANLRPPPGCFYQLPHQAIRCRLREAVEAGLRKDDRDDFRMIAAASDSEGRAKPLTAALSSCLKEENEDENIPEVTLFEKTAEGSLNIWAAMLMQVVEDEKDVIHADITASMNQHGSSSVPSAESQIELPHLMNDEQEIKKFQPLTNLKSLSQFKPQKTPTTSAKENVVEKSHVKVAWAVGKTVEETTTRTTSISENKRESSVETFAEQTVVVVEREQVGRSSSPRNFAHTFESEEDAKLVEKERLDDCPTEGGCLESGQREGSFVEQEDESRQTTIDSESVKDFRSRSVNVVRGERKTPAYNCQGILANQLIDNNEIGDRPSKNVVDQDERVAGSGPQAPRVATEILNTPTPISFESVKTEDAISDHAARHPSTSPAVSYSNFPLKSLLWSEDFEKVVLRISSPYPIESHELVVDGTRVVFSYVRQEPLTKRLDGLRFELTLFGEVEPVGPLPMSCCEIRELGIKIRLKKKLRCRWNRLQASKTTPPFVVYDHSAVCSDDEDEDDNDDEYERSHPFLAYRAEDARSRRDKLDEAKASRPLKCFSPADVDGGPHAIATPSPSSSSSSDDDDHVDKVVNLDCGGVRDDEEEERIFPDGRRRGEFFS